MHKLQYAKNNLDVNIVLPGMELQQQLGNYEENKIMRHAQRTFGRSYRGVNPFTPESDQCQNSPATSQEIWHHTVWRT